MDHDHRPLADKTVQGVYPPGSTFKMVTLMAGLEAGVIDAGTRFYCPGHTELGGRRFHCWRRGGHGTVDAIKSLEKAATSTTTNWRSGWASTGSRSWRASLAWASATTCPCRRWPKGSPPTANGRWPPRPGLADRRQPERLDRAGLRAGVAAAAGGDDRPHRVGPRGSAPADPVRRRRAAGAARIPAAGHQPGIAARRAAWHGRGDEQRPRHRPRRPHHREEWRMAGKTGTSQVRNITAAERARGVISNDQLPGRGATMRCSWPMPPMTRRNTRSRWWSNMAAADRPWPRPSRATSCCSR